MSNARSIGREIGLALAMLGLYLLTLLAPLHEARASQLAFERLGYATTEIRWVICTAGGIEGGEEAGVSTCPATGAGKAGLVPPLLAALPVMHRIAASPSVAIAAPTRPRPVSPPSGPRAPPLLV